MVKFDFFAFKLLTQKLKNKTFTSSYKIDRWTFIFSLSSYQCEVDTRKNTHKYYSSNVREPLALQRSMSWGCPDILKRRSGIDIVFNREGIYQVFV